MKILFVHDFYRNFGGEDAVALAERQMLENRGQELTLYDRHNVEVDTYSPWRRITFPAQTIYSLRTRKEIVDLALNHRPDFAYVHNVFPLISPSIYHILHTADVPSLQVMHDFRFFCPNGWFYTRGGICERCKHGNYLNAVRYRCYRDSYSLSALYALSIGLNRMGGLLEKIDGFICLTEFSRQKLLEIGLPEHRLFVKPNFIDSSLPAAKPGTGEYVLYLGRLSPEKGVWTLVRAFEKLKAAKLKIVGTGPLESSLQVYLRENKINNIELLGFKQGAEKWQILRNSLFLVVPSQWYETFCMVALEAYVAGKPVVASNLGSLPYVVEDGKTGILFNPANPDDLAEKVNHFLLNTSDVSRMGLRGRELAQTKFSPDESYKMLMDIASKVL
jgi:glycosyltransferase involved in cell wall biosynthesis